MIRRNSSRENMLIILSAFLSVIIMMGLTSAVETYSSTVTSGLSSNLIRFHLIANSDSVEDQQMKEHIRDEVLKYMNPLLKESPSIEMTRSTIIKEEENIKAISKEVIRAWGKDYPVEIKLEEADFPTIDYGDISLPAGRYEACRIIIGEGKGKNWWCVMFPPLCYVDITHGLIPVEEKEQLEAVLSPKEFELVTKKSSKDNDSNELMRDTPIKFKFKIVEVFNSRKKLKE